MLFGPRHHDVTESSTTRVPPRRGGGGARGSPSALYEPIHSSPTQSRLRRCRWSAYSTQATAHTAAARARSGRIVQMTQMSPHTTSAVTTPRPSKASISCHAFSVSSFWILMAVLRHSGEGFASLDRVHCGSKGELEARSRGRSYHEDGSNYEGERPKCPARSGVLPDGRRAALTGSVASKRAAGGDGLLRSSCSAHRLPSGSIRWPS